MKRHVLKLVLFLLAGAIINMAVAWGCAVRHAIHRGDAWGAETLAIDAIDATWLQSRGWNFVDFECFGSSNHRGFGSSCQLFYVTCPTDDPPGVGRYRCGWPTYCIEGYSSSFADKRGRVNELHDLYLRGVDSNGRTLVLYLPLQPTPGFAINTIFYAAILYALFALPGAVRRRRRIKRGLCVRCAYPVGVGQRCSECGAPVG